MELEPYHLKDKLHEKLNKAERLRKVLDAMKAELKQKEQELEEKKHEMKQELKEKLI